MFSTNFSTNDFATLVFIPLIFITIRDLKRNWQSVWDDDVTAADRALLLRAALVFTLTVLTLVHEAGHAVAALQYGGKIIEFHYSVIHSWVRYAGHFTDAQDVWIAFAGNLAGIIASLLFLVAACCLRSPPVVAICGYIGWFNLANTIIFYPILSLAGFQGDWLMIYATPAGKLNVEIAAFHALLVFFFIYGTFSNRVKLWFRRRTDPRWDMEYQRWLSQLSVAPSLEGWVNLGYTYVRAGLYGMAKDAADNANLMEPNSSEVARLQASIAYSERKFNDVIRFCKTITNDLQQPPRLRAMAWINAGHAYRELRDIGKALESYDHAIIEDPFLGDARLFKAALLLSAGKEPEALQELRTIAPLPLVWIDESNKMQYQSLLTKALSQIG